MKNPLFEKIVWLTPWACYEVLRKVPKEPLRWEPPKEPLRWVVEETTCPYELAE